MAGYSLLNMANGIIAVTVNLTLNSILIPKYGIIGAATASSISISLWPLMRLFEVRWLLGCWPFTIRTGLIGGSAIIGGLLVHDWTAQMDLLARCGATGALIVVWGGIVWFAGRTQEDQVVFDVVRAKVAKLRA